MKHADTPASPGTRRLELPHWNSPGAHQFVTYRLADSLPRRALRARADETEISRRQRIERWLDQGHGSCCLERPEIASCVVENWMHFDGDRYRLVAWVVMPNHVHVLVATRDDSSLAGIVQSWKSYTGRRIRILTGSSIGWQLDYWDRKIRDEKHLRDATNYIHRNPVIAGLVEEPHEWPWSSASRAGLERHE